MKPLVDGKAKRGGAGYQGLDAGEMMLMRVLEAQKSAVSV